MRLSVSTGEAILTAPTGTTFRALDDGSAVVEDGAGAFVAGVSTDRARHPAGAGGPDLGAAHRHGARPASGSRAWPSRTPSGARPKGGTSLAVTPSAWARAWSQAASVGLWSQLVVREPDADTPRCSAQLECHELGAPDKATWNLEPWRPDVSAVDMIAARCNPE